MASEPSFTYFTCTLGQAAEQNRDRPRDFATVVEFIDVQARVHPDKPAVGFPIPTSDVSKDWDYNVFSFNDLKRGSIVVAKSLTDLVVENKIGEKQKCVGLICPSSEDFLFVWLGLMRAGFSVLLIAPQCPPEAIAHLCKSCEVSTLCYDEVYRDLANSAAKTSSSLVARNFPWQDSETALLSIIRNHSLSLSYTPVHKATSLAVAYIHHTSGTSTGLPKPIPQSHHAAVGVLPRLDDSAATFTTTPLYHGGIADCFRAWTSSAMIWLFPGGIVPITARNIVLSLSVTHQAAVKSKSIFPDVKYFSSVPYVLQMLAEDREGLKWLQEMNIVGVGGAALPESVGNGLVSQEVNLISRFGSAECGFLLSSHRDYSTDRDWQYLRAPSNSAFLKFEKQVDGSRLSELVVLKGWPHMAKTNREDGSFATSDLFEPHPEMEGAWKYHSRSDSQITLITGKKFDPAPVEDAIVATAEGVRDCLIFGNGRQVPGALVFLREDMENMMWEAVADRIWNAIEEVNKNGQDHTRISKDMIVLKREGKLEKSSKGTALRSVAEKTFASDIEAAYTRVNIEGVSISNSGNKSAVEIVREVVIGVLGVTELSNQDDFYQHGVDSASCMRIRNQLGKHFHVEGKPLPWNIVYDCGTIDRVSEFLASRNAGEMEKEAGGKELLELVNRYSILSEPTTINQNSTFLTSESRVKEEVVLLTGATGALGSHILSQLLASPSVTRIYCLLRAKDIEAASIQMQRVLAVLKKRFLLPNSQLPFDKLHFLPASLEKENLGCRTRSYEELITNVSTIIHAAWPVNFSLPLRAFEPSLRGLRNLLQLSHLSSRAVNFVFCSSTAAMLGPNHPPVIPEVVSTFPEDADTLGYSRSKWVAEAICFRIAQFLDTKLKVKIMRIGQLTGDREHGVWNMSEAYPLMLSTVRELGCLPKIQDTLSWLPLDIAARVLCEIALADDERSLDPARGESCDVYHVVNNDTSTSFMDLLGWMKRIRREQFEIVEPAVWLERLEKLESHPAKALIGLWKRAFEIDAEEATKQVTVFETKNAEDVSQTMRQIQPVDEKLVEKIWKWLEGELAESR